MSAVHRKCDASNYETKQLVICSSVKMLSTTGETAGWSIEGVKSCLRGAGGEAKGNWHGHGTTLLRVPTRKILWQLVNKPQLLDGDGSRSGQGAEKPAKPKANFTQKFMQNYFVKFALRQRPLFWWSARSRSRCRCRLLDWKLLKPFDDGALALPQLGSCLVLGASCLVVVAQFSAFEFRV